MGLGHARQVLEEADLEDDKIRQEIAELELALQKKDGSIAQLTQEMRDIGEETIGIEQVNLELEEKIRS